MSHETRQKREEGDEIFWAGGSVARICVFGSRDGNMNLAISRVDACLALPQWASFLPSNMRSYQAEACEATGCRMQGAGEQPSSILSLIDQIPSFLGPRMVITRSVTRQEEPN
jgi:hypothetical protein